MKELKVFLFISLEIWADVIAGGNVPAAITKDPNLLIANRREI